MGYDGDDWAVRILRPRRASDTRGVRRVARASWRAALEGRAPAGFIRAVLHTVYARERLVLGLVDPRRDAFVCERDGVVVGYADGIGGAWGAGEAKAVEDEGAAGEGPVIREADEVGTGGDADPTGSYDLARVYVAPSAWHQGAGRALVDAMLSAARARGVASVRVEVDAENHAALRWWEDLGCVPVGEGTYELPPWSRRTIRFLRSSAPLRPAPPSHPPM